MLKVKDTAPSFPLMLIMCMLGHISKLSKKFSWRVEYMHEVHVCFMKTGDGHPQLGLSSNSTRYFHWKLFFLLSPLTFGRGFLFCTGFQLFAVSTTSMTATCHDLSLQKQLSYNICRGRVCIFPVDSNLHAFLMATRAA